MLARMRFNLECATYCLDLRCCADDNRPTVPTVYQPTKQPNNLSLAQAEPIKLVSVRAYYSSYGIRTVFYCSIANVIAELHAI